ncbi:endonuclease domain-containing protein [Chryseobacterium soli]|uniref:endonuclease domain-containing protein n=1 Tax=Chryseobacterium soli TaxID=445961 RepID=UPI0006915813|nr:DUF559 domain-containing protein [Chryseobacterium soli]
MNQILTYINDVPISSNFVEELPYNPKIKALLKNKQKTGILSEMLFWIQVRARAFHKIDFERQVIIGDHIIDFYAKKLGLAIEIGRPGNDLKQSEDQTRQDFLESLGIKVFKKTAVEVKHDLSAVMNDLEQFIILHYTSAPNPETV